MARVKPDRLLEREELIGQLAPLKSQSKAIEDRIKAIDAEAKADLEATGKDRCTRGDFLLTWVKGRASVAWKAHFLRIAGKDEAAKLAKEAKPTRALSIVRRKES